MQRQKPHGIAQCAHNTMEFRPIPEIIRISCHNYDAYLSPIFQGMTPLLYAVSRPFVTYTAWGCMLVVYMRESIFVDPVVVSILLILIWSFPYFTRVRTCG